jgi:hypothetical protein
MPPAIVTRRSDIGRAKANATIAPDVEAAELGAVGLVRLYGDLLGSKRGRFVFGPIRRSEVPFPRSPLCQTLTRRNGWRGRVGRERHESGTRRSHATVAQSAEQRFWNLTTGQPGVKKRRVRGAHPLGCFLESLPGGIAPDLALIAVPVARNRPPERAEVGDMQGGAVGLGTCRVSRSPTLRTQAQGGTVNLDSP